MKAVKPNKVFDTVAVDKPNRNPFDKSHIVNMSGRMGWLMPCMATDVVPNTTVKIAHDPFVRFAPMVAPVMHRYDVSIHTFFVPNRILWPNWEKYISQEETIAAPRITMDEGMDGEAKRLADYLGIPPVGAGQQPQDVLAFPFAAYQMIYNEWYRDENLVPEVDFELIDGDNTGNIGELAALRRRAYEKDYFTSAFTEAQKGAAVDLPIGQIGGNAPLRYNDPSPPLNSALTGNVSLINLPNNVDLTLPNQEVFAETDGLDITGTPVTLVRRALMLQELLELNARAGTRYAELIYGHFGIRTSDKRLQRPEYICGTKTPVVISEVLNTSATATEPQGNMAGHGVAVTTGKMKEKFIEEHGWVISVMSILPKPAYQQGIARKFSRFDPYDYFWPKLQHIGEQEILNKEIFAYQGANDNLVWGYQSRYSEYKYEMNRVAGDFRGNLSFWQGGRIFANAPGLTQEFIECEPEDQDRIFAVQTDDDRMYMTVVNKYIMIGPFAVYSNPGI